MQQQKEEEVRMVRNRKWVIAMTKKFSDMQEKARGIAKKKETLRSQ